MILQTKPAAGYVTDDGDVIEPHTLYRYVDEHGDGGCWYASIANARRSWDRRRRPGVSGPVAGEVPSARDAHSGSGGHAPSVSAELNCREGGHRSPGFTSPPAVQLYDLPIFAWAWREDARDVERY